MRQTRLLFAGVLLLLAVFGVVPAPSSASAARGDACPLRPQDGPCLQASPASGPIGTRIVLSGSVAGDGRNIRRLLATNFIGLIRDVRNCEIIAGSGHPQLRITKTGQVIDSAPLVVGRNGSCNHSDAHQAVTPGRYAIFAGCFTCEVAYFRVTASAPTKLAATGFPFAQTLEIGLTALAGGIWLTRRFRTAR